MTRDIVQELRSVESYHTHLWWAKAMLETADEIDQLREALRVASGGCRMLSQGDACDCGLCKRDAEIARLRAERLEPTLYQQRLAAERDACRCLLQEATATCDWNTSWTHHTVSRNWCQRAREATA